MLDPDNEGRSKIGLLEAVPAMGLDGLGSAAYGPEAMLVVLAAAGQAGNNAMQPVTWAVVLLLALVALSYGQMIAAYPDNGGSYSVAKHNLGANVALLAAASLMLDYVLNAAVGISAGIGALVSAVPALRSFTLPLALGVLAAITALNLRGTKQAGLALALPTYLFIVSLLTIVALGVWAGITGAAAPAPIVPPPAEAPPAEAPEPVTLWLLLRAFTAGCTAMTGVEAVSNGVTAFREPAVRHARRTLLAICCVLAVLLIGIAFLADRYNILALDETSPGYQSVVSQVALVVCGRNWLYYVTIGSVLAVLCLSANTSFVGLPRLCRQLARDGSLPAAFAVPGAHATDRVGILSLAASAGLLLTLFGGITDRLVPLFAIGAFLSFSLGQYGMTVHWLRAGGGHWGKATLNGLGALATAAVLVVMLSAKFCNGAWLTVIVVPALFLVLVAGRRDRRSARRGLVAPSDG